MAAPKNMTPAQRVLRAKVAAHTSWAGTANRVERTSAARQAANDRFAKQVDPDGVLSPEERALRAQSARRAHFSQMAMKSSKARSAKARGRAGAATGRG